MILRRTKTLCTRCGVAHEAEVVIRDNCVLGIVCCPEGEYEHQMSSDAERYCRLMEKSFVNLDCEPSRELRFVLNYISITDGCNFNCTICGANAKHGRKESVFLSVQEVSERAANIRRDGGKLLHLIGGEPTLHPDLLTMVQRLSKMGFQLGVVTNGYLLGEDIALAFELKRSGLTRVCMQFDSFDQATLERLGRDCLQEKSNAIRYVIEAGLSLGLNCTVTKDNLSELGTLLKHGLELGHHVKNMTFASAAPVGRYLLEVESTDRETIIKQLSKVGEQFCFTVDDFLPLPSYLPWGIQIHPDCGAHAVFLRTPSGICPLNALLDMTKLYRLMSRNRMRRHLISMYVIPFFYALRSARMSRLFALFKCAIGLLFCRDRYSLVNVGVSNYRGAMFLDLQRIGRCASAFYTSVGAVRGCLHFFMGEGFPGSREYEVSKGKC